MTRNIQTFVWPYQNWNDNDNVCTLYFLYVCLVISRSHMKAIFDGSRRQMFFDILIYLCHFSLSCVFVIYWFIKCWKQIRANIFQEICHILSKWRKCSNIRPSLFLSPWPILLFYVILYGWLVELKYALSLVTDKGRGLCMCIKSKSCNVHHTKDIVSIRQKASGTLNLDLDR